VATYVLFCADVPNPSDKTPDLRRVVSVNLDSMGGAIKTACELLSDGVIVWQIKGSDGFIMERRDIETEFLRRQGVQIRP
jgi:hypothetical protein